MKIYIETDTSNAPGSLCYLVDGTGDRTTLIQSQDDACGVAETFGWNIRDVQSDDEQVPSCGHCQTDGTVDCPDCGMGSAAFISAACDYINCNDGASAEDPGYFSEE